MENTEAGKLTDVHTHTHTHTYIHTYIQRDSVIMTHPDVTLSLACITTIFYITLPHLSAKNFIPTAGTNIHEKLSITSAVY